MEPERALLIVLITSRSLSKRNLQREPELFQSPNPAEAVMGRCVDSRGKGLVHVLSR